MNLFETVSIYGSEVLSLNEVVAIALGMTSEKFVGVVGNGTLRELFDKSLAELRQMTTPAIAMRIFAMGEVIRRQRMMSTETRPTINNPIDVSELLMEEMRYLNREHFRVILLNTKNGVLKIEEISVGTLNSSLVHPREVFKAAVKGNANAIILVHNHPSGDPTPSREDVEVTTRLADVGKLMGVEVIDHVVLGDGRYISLKERGIL